MICGSGFTFRLIKGRSDMNDPPTALVGFRRELLISDL